LKTNAGFGEAYSQGFENKPHLSEVIKDVLSMAEDLKIFCSDVDILGTKFLVDQL
jgi:hypothetical protein